MSEEKKKTRKKNKLQIVKEGTARKQELNAWAEAGRGMAIELLTGAVQSAETPTDLANQLRLYSSMSCHVMATQIRNAVMQGRATREEATELMVKQLLDEVEYVFDTEGRQIFIKGTENGAGEAAQKVEGTPNEPA